MRLAVPADETALRSLLRRSVIHGAVRVAFTREPSYAAGDGLAGADDATVVAWRDGRLVAMGRCSVHTLHRNGTQRRIGYLGELRFDPEMPSSARGMRDGYAKLAESARRSGAEGFFTSIADDNARARRVLENGGRLGLPTYRPLCRLVTLLAPVPRATAGADSAGRGNERGLAAGAGDEQVVADAAELTAFLARHAREAHLALSWDEARWKALAVHGITPHDFAVVRRDGRIVAAAAAWDQRAFRQTVIDGYSGALRLARPLVNAALALTGRPALPAAGEVLAQGSLLAASVDDARDWPALWRATQARAAARGLSWLALARDRRDPSCAPLRRRLRARAYHTTLYDVAWRDRPEWPDPWDSRLFRPEVALL